jgi:hypothetical protein
MVGVARIELATPAMSTRAAPANLLIFRDLGGEMSAIWPMESQLDNGSSSD